MTEVPKPLLTLQIAILVIGIGLWLWSLTRGRHLLPWRGENRLRHWDIPASDFLLLIFVVLLFIFIGSQAAVYWSDKTVIDEPTSNLAKAVIYGYSFHLCSIVAWIVFSFIHSSVWPGRRQPWISSAISAVRSLLFAIPIILVIGIAWSALLYAVDLPTEPQDLIGIIRDADNLGYLIALGVLAVAIAPINEELLFRGGLFRFFNTRMPTSIAMILSSILFAILHLNWFSFLPLVVLGCFLCTATLKTGSLKSAMIMHALFNLNSVVSILFISPK
jgi:membrane protease YdiL (CAAX protease family)